MGLLGKAASNPIPIPTVRALDQEFYEALPNSRGTRSMCGSARLDCSFLTQYRDEDERWNSYYDNAPWPHLKPTPSSLASAGLFYDKCRPARRGVLDRAQCAFCQIIIWNWRRDDSPMEEHRKHSPDCRFVLGVADDNIPISASFSDSSADLSSASSESYPSSQEAKEAANDSQADDLEDLGGAEEIKKDSFKALNNAFENFLVYEKRESIEELKNALQKFLLEEKQRRENDFHHVL